VKSILSIMDGALIDAEKLYVAVQGDPQTRAIAYSLNKALFKAQAALMARAGFEEVLADLDYGERTEMSDAMWKAYDAKMSSLQGCPPSGSLFAYVL